MKAMSFRRAAILLILASQTARPVPAQSPIAESELSPASQFSKLCEGCHGPGATGTDRGPALINNRGLRNRSVSQIRDTIHNGTTGGMPAFPLPDERLLALA